MMLHMFGRKDPNSESEVSFLFKGVYLILSLDIWPITCLAGKMSETPFQRAISWQCANKLVWSLDYIKTKICRSIEHPLHPGLTCTWSLYGGEHWIWLSCVLMVLYSVWSVPHHLLQCECLSLWTVKLGLYVSPDPTAVSQRLVQRPL